MYRPNFCAECGAKIVRLQWHSWTSRVFCDPCAKRFRKERIKASIIVMVVLMGLGYAAGRAGRPAAPPLTIERSINSPLSNAQPGSGSVPATSSAATAAVSEDNVYICGARTRKGTPCSRRVHGPVRCWQHKGLRAMLAQEKLLVKDQP